MADVVCSRGYSYGVPQPHVQPHQKPTDLVLGESNLPISHPAFDPNYEPNPFLPEARKRRNAAKGKTMGKGGDGDDVFGG